MDWLQLIQQVGFPIVMTGVLCYYVKYTNDHNSEQYASLQDKFIETVKEISEEHQAEIKTLTDKIDALKGEKQ